MLEKLIARIAQGGSFTTQSLAQELGTSREMIESMLADLSRAGYLQPANPCGDQECRGCHAAAGCIARQKTWVLVNSRIFHEC